MLRSGKEDVRHYGNLDYIVKSEAGIGIGAASMQIEIGSTEATPAGLLDANSAAITTAYLEVIDRNNGFLSTGLRRLSQLFTLGNTLATTVGFPAPSQMAGSWTPIDASGAGLTLSVAEGWWERMGDTVRAWGRVTFPATVDATAAKLGGLPFTVKNNGYARGGCQFGVTTLTGAQMFLDQNATTLTILNSAGAGFLNSDCAGRQFYFMAEYPV